MKDFDSIKMHGTTVKISEYELFIIEGADRPALYDSRSES
jgi:hypothetical protein